MRKILSLLIYCFVRLLHQTYRYRYEGNENLKKLAEKKQNFIFAIWHQNLFSGILAQSGLPHIVIVSQSKDAEPVAFTCKHLGHFVVRGSSKKCGVDKGGNLAKQEMIHYLNQGHPGAVTVDGPKGPALKVKPGIIDMARQTQAHLIPYTVCSNSYWQFKSWDLFRLPKPFAKLLVSYGEPILVPELCEEFLPFQEKLETSLNQLTIHSEKSLLDWKNHTKNNWYE